MKSLFKLAENGTTVRTEIRAGLTTFCAMAYIIFLNPVFLSATGMDANGVLISTCVSAAIGTLLCAFVANKPIALAAGMGLNTMFAYTLCLGSGYSWQQGLALIFLAGLIFFAVAVSPLRGIILKAFPANLKHAITAGIGLFIAEIGLLDAGIITMTAGFPALGDLHSGAVLVAIAGVVVTMILVVCRLKSALILGMIFTVILNIACGLTAMPTQIFSLPTAFGSVFLKLDFTGLGSSGIFSLLAMLLTLSIVDMFDTVGFLIGIDTNAHVLQSEKDSRAILAVDAGATVLGALCGCSTVTSFAESATGIAAGGKTGLTSLTTGICFLLAMFLSPLAGVISSAATAPALIIVGMYMVADVRNINFSDMDEALPAFITVLAMPMAYSITAGIGMGFVSYVVCKLAAGKAKELNIPVIVLAAVFLLYFCL